MTEHELFQKTFSTLHASPDTLMEVQKTMENSKKTHRTLRRGVVIAIAAALTLTVAAATGVVTLIKANVSHADKVDDTTYHAFTDDMDASTPTVEGNSGELITLPDMERIPGDRDTVQRLVGDYLSKLDAELTVGSTTITLETFLVDESGCGILTYTVDDPEGVSYEDAGYGEVYSLPLEPRMYLRSPDYQQGGSVNVKLHVDKTTSTATHLDVVAYFAAGETYQKGDNFYFTVYDGGGEGREPYAVAIQPRTYAPVRTLTAADGEVVRISAVGITMDNASPRPGADRAGADAALCRRHLLCGDQREPEPDELGAGLHLRRRRDRPLRSRGIYLQPYGGRGHCYLRVLRRPLVRLHRRAAHPRAADLPALTGTVFCRGGGGLKQSETERLSPLRFSFFNGKNVCDPALSRGSTVLSAAGGKGTCSVCQCCIIFAANCAASSAIWGSFTRLPRSLAVSSRQKWGGKKKDLFMFREEISCRASRSPPE